MVIINPERTSRTLRAGWYRNTTYTFRPEPLPAEREGVREAEREEGVRDLDDAEYGGARQQLDSSNGEHEPVPPGSEREQELSVMPLPAPAFAEPCFMSPDVYREHTQVPV